jgi:outer membrane lipoprotein carrier protein
MRYFRILVFLLLFAPAAFAADLRQLVQAVDRHYNALRSMRADFTESYSGNGIERTESGVLLLKKPGKMRWDYEQPRQKLFVTNGKMAWFYVPSERQGRKAPVKQLSDLRSPLRYLLGKTRLGKELTGLSLAPDVAPLETGNTVLRGVPKGMEDRVSDVVMEVTPEGRIVRLVIHEVDGATTDFRFRNLVDNPPLADAQFQFAPPPGVEMVEGAVSF